MEIAPSIPISTKSNLYIPLHRWIPKIIGEGIQGKSILTPLLDGAYICDEVMGKLFRQLDYAMIDYPTECETLISAISKDGIPAGPVDLSHKLKITDRSSPTFIIANKVLTDFNKTCNS